MLYWPWTSDLLISYCIALPSYSLPITATDKLAILLGQSNYRSNNKQLPAVRNDLYEAHELFSSLGFKTVSSLDTTLDEMNKMINLAVDMMRGSANDKLYGKFIFIHKSSCWICLLLFCFSDKTYCRDSFQHQLDFYSVGFCTI